MAEIRGGDPSLLRMRRTAFCPSSTASCEPCILIARWRPVCNSRPWSCLTETSPSPRTMPARATGRGSRSLDVRVGTNIDHVTVKLGINVGPLRAVSRRITSPPGHVRMARRCVYTRLLCLDRPLASRAPRKAKPVQPRQSRLKL